MPEQRNEPATQIVEDVSYRSLLVDLRDRLRARSDAAYCQMASVRLLYKMQGLEAKFVAGKFGRKELDSHKLAEKLHGQHIAFAEACKEIDAVLDGLPERVVEHA